MSGTAVLAYSGGLDTSCAIAWLKEDYGFDEVVAVLVDVGQEAEFATAVERGRLAGADDVVVLDRTDAFAGRPGRQGAGRKRALRGPVSPRLGAVAAGDRRGRGRHRGPARRRSRRPRVHREGQRPAALRARLQGEVPRRPRDRALARPRLDEDEEIAYAVARGIPVEASTEKPYSIDDNLLGRAIEAGVLEDPWHAPPDDAFVLTASPLDAPAPTEVVIAFEAGLPASLDDEAPLHELVQGSERSSRPVRDRPDRHDREPRGRHQGLELYEAPAALTLIEAHRALEELVLTKGELRASGSSSLGGRTSSTRASGSTPCARPTTRSSPPRSRA